MPINLYFKNSGEWCALPQWVEYFIGVGEEFALADFNHASRIVTAIIVPTRAYCAAFISLGIVVGDAIMMERPPESVHFNMLLELQPGTSVTYNHQEGKIFKGILQPPEKLHGQQWVKVQTSSKAGGALTHFINEERAFQVYPASHSGKLPKRQDGKDKKFLNEFVNSLLRGCDLVEFDTQSKFVCAIVGKRSLLEQEIRQTTLATYIGGGRWAEGSLQDVLKIDRFTTGSQTHRSALIPTGVNQPPGDIMSNIAISIVFDGAVGFLKWGHLWPNRHQIIILDRAEPYLYDAINAINSNFLQNRVNIACCDQYGEATPPPGTELLVFREGIL